MQNAEDKMCVGDVDQMMFVKQDYNFLVSQKFDLLEKADNLRVARKGFGHLSFRMQELTDEIIRLDQKRNELARV